MEQRMTLFLNVVLLFIPAIVAEEIIVSLSKTSSDHWPCGNATLPCNSLSLALHLYVEGDVISIDGGENQLQPYVYHINETVTIPNSLVMRKLPNSTATPMLTSKQYSGTGIVVSNKISIKSINISYIGRNHNWFLILNCQQVWIADCFFNGASIGALSPYIRSNISIERSQLTLQVLHTKSLQTTFSFLIGGFIDQGRIIIAGDNIKLVNISVKNGAIQAESDRLYFLVKNSNLTRCPLDVRGKDFIAVDSIFKDLSTDVTVPSLYVSSTSVNLTRCTFINNTAAWGVPFDLRIVDVVDLIISRITIIGSRNNGPIMSIDRKKLQQHLIDLKLTCGLASFYTISLNQFNLILGCTRCTRNFYSIVGTRFVLNTTSRWKKLIANAWTISEGSTSLWRRQNTSFSTRQGNSLEDLTAFFSRLNGFHKCYECPFGGVCDGTIKSKGDYWGYINKTNVMENREWLDNVIFVPCLSHYCCPTKEKCLTYNTCRVHRKGTMCSECMKGYSCSITGRHQCIKNSECYTPLVPAIIYILIVALFLNVMLYLKDIIFSVKNIFKSNQGVHKVDSSVQMLTESSLHESLEPGSNREPEPNQLLTTSDNVKSMEYKTTSSIASGSVKIFFFFYQAAMIIRVETTDKAAMIFPKMLDVLVSFFNIRIDLDYSGFPLCVMKNMDIVKVELFKLGYLLIIVVLLFLMCAVNHVYKQFNKKHGEQETSNHQEISLERIDENVPTYCKLPFAVRINCTYLQFLLIGFSAISVFCLHAIHCVSINNEQFLYIQASIQCYQPWQYIIMAAIALWVIPFGLTVHFASKMLESCLISPMEFLLILTFPVFIIWFVIMSRYRKMITLNTSDAMLSKHLLLVINEPFKESQWISWEAVLIIRRLMLASANIFIMSPIQRLFPSTMMLIIFRIHHRKVKPFKNEILNKVELYTIDLLISLVFVNIYWAFTIEYDMADSSSYRNFGKVLIVYEMVVLSLPLILLVFFIFYKLLKKIYKRCLKKAD